MNNNLTEKDTFEKIKERGYWQIEIRPTKFLDQRLSLVQCKKLVELSQVQLRGWHYPHFGVRHGDLFNANNYAESFVNHNQHNEIWRIYQSGQFVHYLSFWEDWIEHEPYRYNFTTERGSNLPNVKEVLMTLYTVTEIFLFASKLALENVFGNDLQIIIKLCNTSNRELIMDQFGRDLDRQYICKIDEIEIKKNISTEDIIKNNKDLSLDTTIDIFHRFNWHLSDDTKGVLQKDQEKFLSRNT